MFSDPRKYIFLILIATVMAGFSLASILTYTDPSNASLLIFIFLYLSVFLFSIGLLTLFSFFFRKVFFKTMFAHNLSNSLRQAILLSMFLVFCLALSSHGLLFWWVAVTLFLPFAFLEAFINLKN